MSDRQPILVTGAAGFIGSHVAEALLRRGESVVGVDCFDPFYDPDAKRANADEVAATARACGGDWSLRELDICDATALQKLFQEQRFGGVIHLAARAGVRPSIAQPVLYARVNVEGTTALLQAAASSGCRRFIAASSSSVYGNNRKTPFAEDDAVELPISPYAATKRACELIGATMHHLTRMPVGMLRFFTVFGPRQRPDLAISLFLSKVSRGEPIQMFGDGSTSRDYTFVDDIVRGVLAAFDQIPAHGFRVWNLGGDRPTSLRDMVATIERVTGQRAIVTSAPAQPGDVERTWADLSRSRAELGYAPVTRFEAGVAKQWEWMQRRHEFRSRTSP